MFFFLFRKHLIHVTFGEYTRKKEEKKENPLYVKKFNQQKRIPCFIYLMVLRVNTIWLSPCCLLFWYVFTPVVPSGGTIQAWQPMKSKGVDPYVSKTTYHLTSDINREHNFWAAKHLIECKVPCEMVDVYLGIIFFVRGNPDNREDKRAN